MIHSAEPTMTDSKPNPKPAYIAATLMGAAVVILGFGAFGPSHPWMAYVSGTLAAASFVTCACATGGSRGEDGRFSSSKLQFIIWTTAFLFALFALLTRTLRTAGGSLPADIPSYLFGAMGLSALTLVGAKGIATNQVNQGKRPAPADEKAAQDNDQSKGGFFTGDDGDTSLTKVQMLFFNALAAGIFVILTLRQLNDNPAVIALKWPDIDPTLLMLCGLGNAAYVGRKLVPATDPMITRLSPDLLTPGARVTLRGANLGTIGGMVLLDGHEIHIPAADWSQHAVSFTVPLARADGTRWRDDQKHTLILERADGLSANPLETSFAPDPTIDRVLPAGTVTPGTKVMVQGAELGRSPGAVLLAGQKLILPATDWSPGYLVFTIPPMQPNGAEWPAVPQDFSLAIARADGLTTRAFTLSIKKA